MKHFDSELSAQQDQNLITFLHIVQKLCHKISFFSVKSKFFLILSIIQSTRNPLNIFTQESFNSIFCFCFVSSVMMTDFLFKLVSKKLYENKKNKTVLLGARIIWKHVGTILESHKGCAHREWRNSKNDPRWRRSNHVRICTR